MNLNPKIRRATDFQSVINYLLNLNPHKKIDKSLIAARMGVRPDTLQRHLSGIISSDADFARDLIRAMAEVDQDICLELLQFFTPEGFSILKDDLVEAPLFNTGTLQDLTLELSATIGRLQNNLLPIIKSGLVDIDNYRVIRGQIAFLKTIASEIQKKLEA